MKGSAKLKAISAITWAIQSAATVRTQGVRAAARIRANRPAIRPPRRYPTPPIADVAYHAEGESIALRRCAHTDEAGATHRRVAPRLLA